MSSNGIVCTESHDDKVIINYQVSHFPWIRAKQ